MKNLIYLLFISFIVFTGCTNKDEDIAIKQGLALMKVWETGNTDELSNLMDEDAVYIAAQQMRSFNGLEEISKYVEHLYLFSENLSIEVLSIHASQDHAVIEWLMSGIQNKPIPGSIDIATNKEYTLNGITLIELKNGLIIKATDYMDVLGFVLQLGACVELPGGVRLGCENTGD